MVSSFVAESENAGSNPMDELGHASTHLEDIKETPDWVPWRNLKPKFRKGNPNKLVLDGIGELIPGRNYT